MKISLLNKNQSHNKEISITEIDNKNWLDFVIKLKPGISFFIDDIIKYHNIDDDTFNYEKRFSFFKDFDQEEVDLSSVEEEFVEEIFDQIIIDMFNESVANLQIIK